jgi:hypothetical protein
MAKMVRIIDGRCTGKTRKLFEAAKEHGAVIVCSNPLAFEDKAYGYGIGGLTFMSYSDFMFGEHDPDITVMIDELENFLNFFSTCDPVCHIVGYTLSNED